MTFMPVDTETVLRVQDLHTHFFTDTGIVKAVNGVSFDLLRGERVAIVGESGSGKSAMAMSLIRLLAFPGKIVSGRIDVAGNEVASLPESKLNKIRGSLVGTVFQDPMSSLDPVMRVSDQMIPPVMRHLEVSHKEGEAIAERWLGRVGIPDAKLTIRAYPFEMSGGMRQRVMIAMALSCNPRLIIADEPTTALDVTIQAQIVELLKDLTAETGASMLFVTHDLGLVARFAHKVGVMYAGKLFEFGPAADVFAQPRHPYTQGLLRSIPDAADGTRKRLFQIPGFPPDMRLPIVGCAFADRCAAVRDICRTEAPESTYRGVNHFASCWSPTGLDQSVVERQVKMPERIVEAELSPDPVRADALRSDVLEMNNIHKHFVRRSILPWTEAKTVHAVNGVSLRVKRGETLGIVGESGCGKSTVARLLLGIEEPTAGEIFINGSAQMVFQDPYSSFNPKMKIFDIVEEPLVVNGQSSRAERAEKVCSLVSQVGLDQSFLGRYPNQLSGGQRQRVAIARALALDPSVVVADEPTSALDVSVRAQIVNLLCDLKDELGISFVFISHDLLTVRYISDRIAVMYLGEVVEYGPAAQIFDDPLHPYTRALLLAIPTPDPVREAARKIELVTGELPSPFVLQKGCAFASRCPKVADRCRTEKPVLRNFSRQRETACHYAA